MATTNYSVYALPVYWVLALIPHAYAVNLIKKSNNGQWNNVNPRSSAWASKIEKSVPADILATFERCEAAHKNSMENLPLLASAIILGNVAKLPAGTLNGVVGTFMGLRVAYTYAYVNTTRHSASFIRSGLWLSSTVALMYLIVASGNVLAKGYN